MSAHVKFLHKVLLVLNVHTTLQCPQSVLGDVKAAYKSGEQMEQSTPVTLDKIKTKLKESGIFDQDTAELTEMETKELKKLYDTIEIMTTSRNRQPQSVQNLFSSLRMLERVIKKQLKEGQVSETLAAKFHWELLSGRQKRENALYELDETTNMRVFTKE